MRLDGSRLALAGVILLSGCGGGGSTDSGTQVVSPPPVPAVTLTSSAASVPASQSVTLTWSATDATVCTASGDWTGVKSITGSESVTVPHAGAGDIVPMGFGADTNGLAHQSPPPSAAITYPFTLFSGAGWGAKFTGIAPVVFDKQVTGEKPFDYNAEGFAHYGLIPDWVEDVRKQGGEQAINALYSSAEEYLQMWEKTCARSGTGCE